MAKNEFSDSDDLVMRPIRPEEFDEFELLVQEIKSITEPPESWVPYEGDELRRLLDSEFAYNLGLYEKDRLVGTAFLVKPGQTLLTDSHELALCGIPSKGTAELTHIMLDSDWRGNGYASGLVDDLVQMALSATRTIRRVYALVSPYDKQSRKLFERALFIGCCGAKVPDGREMFVYHRWYEDNSTHGRK